MSTERAIVIDSVYDDFCEVLARKIQEIAADEHLHELAVSGEVPARKVKDLVEEAMSKVCGMSLAVLGGILRR